GSGGDGGEGREAARGGAGGAWPAEELLDERAAEVVGLGAARREQGRAGRDQEARDLRHETVADGERRVGGGRLAEAEAVLRDADDHAGDDVDADDDQARDGV